MQLVRDQIGASVYTVHRLDKPTSGALLFALSPETARTLSEAFAAGVVDKTYLALVRGWPGDIGVLDYPLKEEIDKTTDEGVDPDKAPQTAVTKFEVLRRFELPFEVDRFPTARYALVKAVPLTGRRHQIRRHLRHLGHPIVGDITYGVGKHNRFFENQFGVRRLLLACTGLGFPHPVTGDRVFGDAAVAEEFQGLLDRLGEFERPFAPEAFDA
jgi:tRNA pseudouridine65 synthase